MPELDKIMPAIAAAMGEVQKVGKEGRNSHDGYNFASIDNFLALVNPICARHGIIVSMQENGLEDFTRKGKFGENPWMRMTWEITVFHASGQSLPPVNRTVEVLRNGAQAYGSAQSYALKQFLRSLFLIPTGDKDDADLAPTDAGEITSHTRAAPRQQEHRQPPRDAAPDPVQIAVESLRNAATLDALVSIWGSVRDVQKDPRVIKAKDDRKAALSNPVTDEIPY